MLLLCQRRLQVLWLCIGLSGLELGTREQLSCLPKTVLTLHEAIGLDVAGGISLFRFLAQSLSNNVSLCLLMTHFCPIFEQLRNVKNFKRILKQLMGDRPSNSTFCWYENLNEGSGPHCPLCRGKASYHVASPSPNPKTTGHPVLGTSMVDVVGTLKLSLPSVLYVKNEQYFSLITTHIEDDYLCFPNNF